MQLLPYDTFTIQTQKPLSDVIEQLEANIEAPKALRWNFSRNHAPYTGTISNSGFEIHRLIHYRNSFLPNIRGRFESLSEGTVIRITMRLHPFVIVFLLFWYSVWYSIVPYLLFEAWSGDMQIFIALQFLGLPLVLLFVFWCVFWYEANRSRQELAQIILEGAVEQQTSGNLARRRTFKMLGITAMILWNAVFLYFFF